MAPIRLGLIGLTAKPNAWANIAHLPYLSQSSKYQIVALANSSVASATAAIKEHKLSADTKAYGSPADIAADPDVDMVVVSVAVAQHYDLIKPALEAGKMAYVEWPLGNNTAEAEELTELAKKKNLRTVVGLQGRQSNLTRTVKKLVGSGKLGKVLSSTMVAESGFFDGRVPVKYRYITDPMIGGNHFTIGFGHFLDTFVDVLGEVESSQAVLANQRPLMDVVDDGKTVETIHKDAADHIMVQGKLQSGAVFAISTRAGQPPGMTWKILLEKGQISIEAPAASLQWSYENDAITVKQFDKATEQTEKIELEEMELEDVKTPARMIGRVYEAFASGGQYHSFETALEHHRRLDKIVEGALRVAMDV